MLSKYNHIDSTYVNGFNGIIPPYLVDDMKKSIHYYFWRNNIRRFKKVKTSIGIGYYKRLKLKCDWLSGAVNGNTKPQTDWGKGKSVPDLFSSGFFTLVLPESCSLRGTHRAEANTCCFWPSSSCSISYPFYYSVVESFPSSLASKIVQRHVQWRSDLLCCIKVESHHIHTCWSSPEEKDGIMNIKKTLDS